MSKYATNTAQIADQLRDLASRLDRMDSTTIPATWVGLSLQVSRHKGSAPEADRIATVKALAEGVLDVEATMRSGDQFGVKIGGINMGCVNVNVYTGVESERERLLREENEALRAELAAATRPAMDTIPSPDAVRMALFNAEQTGQLVIGAYLAGMVCDAIIAAGYGTPILDPDGGPDGSKRDAIRVGFLITDAGRAVSTASRNECPFTHSHTRAWCGYAGCRES